MMSCAWSYGQNHSALYRQLRAYFRSRGVTNDRKIDVLTARWFRQKGKRPPVQGGHARD